MKQVLIRGGRAEVAEVPAPQVGPRHVLVRVAHSCVSAGTEAAGVRASAMPLYRRALKHPEHVLLALKMARDEGVGRTVNAIRGVLNSGNTVGYSAAGLVVEVGAEVDGIRPGDLVACAGAGLANHAEYINVPVNLVARLPAGLDTGRACTVTLGAIALQGVRRTAPTLGEYVAVAGLGLLGQLTAQLLKLAGCRVIGSDPDGSRVATALGCGMDRAAAADPEGFLRDVLAFTNGQGADAVIITAASDGHQIVSQAMQACRKKGRVVLVGDVGLNLRREDMYRKELDFLISTSYGPGRYDPVYEEGGHDYPLAYVRWTENRNMEEYLKLVAEGRLCIAPLMGSELPVDRAAEAYESLVGDAQRPMMVILAYPERPDDRRRSIRLAQTGASRPGRMGVALVGAGAFATGTHLPNLAKLRKDFELRAVVSRDGAKAKAVALRYEAPLAATDLDEVLAEPGVDLVFITTRHDLHAGQVAKALRAGKNVFVEKPLALCEEELAEVAAALEAAGPDRLLMTGFNRRFSPVIARTRELLSRRNGPLMLHYRMNAGYLPPEHWVHGPEGGGRNIGEACHIYDLFTLLCGNPLGDPVTQSILPASPRLRRNDNFTMAATFADGSVCSLTYTALGHPSHPKESFELYCDGMVLSMSDYRKLEVTGGQGGGLSLPRPDKGHAQELEALAKCLLRGGAWPIPWEEQVVATRMSFQIEALLA